MLLLLTSLLSERGECKRMHFDVVTIIVDHANELATLFCIGWRCKVKDGANFLVLRLNFIRQGDIVAKIFNFLDGKEAFFGLNGKIKAVHGSKANFYILQVILEGSLSKNDNVINKTFYIGQISEQADHNGLGNVQSNFHSHWKALIFISAERCSDGAELGGKFSQIEMIKLESEINGGDIVTYFEQWVKRSLMSGKSCTKSKRSSLRRQVTNESGSAIFLGDDESREVPLAG